MEYISFEHNNIAAELVKQAYDTPPLAFVHSYGCQQNVNDGERIKGVLMDIGYGLCDKPERQKLPFSWAACLRRGSFFVCLRGRNGGISARLHKTHCTKLNSFSGKNLAIPLALMYNGLDLKGRMFKNTLPYAADDLKGGTWDVV